MEENRFGDHLRKLRMDLGLTQEELAERIGGTCSQAEISRLERGQVSMPRRARLDDLAAALEVSLGELLIHSGWLTTQEGDQVDDTSTPEEHREEPEASLLLEELATIQDALLILMDRVASVERLLRQQTDSHTEHTNPLANRAFAETHPQLQD
jgi:transcriptional regulator with XRE-family HTH domain